MSFEPFKKDEGFTKIAFKMPVVKEASKNIHSEAHDLVDQITQHFGEKKMFGRYLGVVKRVGVQQARIIFNEVRDSSAKNPGKLFMWKCSKKAREWAEEKRRQAAA